MHELAIRNARLLQDGTWRHVDIGIDEGRFTSFAPNSAKKTLNANGRMIFPGGVDLHVHFNEPGRTHWEGFATGSLAAAAGGNTFLVEMPLNSIPTTVSVETLRSKLAAIAQKSLVDFGLWGGLVPGNVKDIEGLHRAGVAGFKAFMSPSGTDDFKNSDVATLRAGMIEIAKTGKVLAIHAEDPAILREAETKLAQKRTALDWERSRPIEAEMSAVNIAIDLAGETGCRIHIVHVSAPEVLELIASAKAKGVAITCETCPHYLLMSMEEADAIGPNAKCAPPLRPRHVMETMWTALSNGLIDTIGSDHSPCTPDLKTGRAYYDAWGGISGIQHGLPLLWQEALVDSKLLQSIIELSSIQAANLINLSEKGAINLGYDADFVLAETLSTPYRIKTEALHYRNRHSPYCDRTLTVTVSETWLRGTCLYRKGEAASEPNGKFLAF
ncbi:allantoinase AllB [Pelagicoccus sp. SDUM812002]|uniref:allantoinase AllB n=1 Tax=Pelagicoccus sp. SDUM812002 TaxID=3041266 RepID=UPI0028107930|nr:allantoinase AllB [Pelagicoccus sp. SDUM812002]MDQ8187769.1 allantoinase AllB [Pelagicoccus sp. SDUM812002]